MTKAFYLIVLTMILFLFSLGVKADIVKEEISPMDCSSGVCFPSSTSLPDPSGGVVQIINNVLTWILSIFGVLAIISFVISGMQYILSVGDEKTIDTAKRNIKWSIVGVVVALTGLVIIYAIDKMLRGTPNF